MRKVAAARVRKRYRYRLGVLAITRSQMYVCLLLEIFAAPQVAEAALIRETITQSGSMSTNTVPRKRKGLARR